MESLPRLIVFEQSEWADIAAPSLQAQMLHALEAGQVLFFPKLMFEMTRQEQAFLSPTFVSRRAKNISYQPTQKTLKGACGTEQELAQIKNMLARFSEHATRLIVNALPHYRDALKVGRTSFRPVEISQRTMSYRKDDKRLHVDAFPSSPNQGQRILRVFSNINLQNQPRVWRLGEPFERVAQYFLPRISKPWPGSRFLLRCFKITKSSRTEYDHIMLKLHNLMKKDLNYQREASQETVNFPAQTTWIVNTDQVSHAAMTGQHLLEQTFYLPVEAMLNPNKSPLKILENLLGHYNLV